MRLIGIEATSPGGDGQWWARKRLFAEAAVIALALAVLIAPTSALLSTRVSAARQPLEKIRIAQQFGLVYAPLSIARELEIFEKHGLQVEWRQLGSGAAINEALIAGQVDVGFMGIPPFLIGWDKGVPWKVAVGFGEVPIMLITYRKDIKSLTDFTSKDRIALPSPGSVQHLLLGMAARRELGNAKALDSLLVAMAHPDGMAALLARRGITAHFTTPPYAFELLSQPGFHAVLTDRQAFGGRFSFNVGVVTKQFHDSRPQAYRQFVAALTEAMNWLETHKKEAAPLLAPEFNLSVEKTYAYLTWPGVHYTVEVRGLMKFARFMYENGFIRNMPASLDDLVWENARALVPPGEE
ncbi:MAG: ABC transporter substrate-binding protein [Limnochordales bacterium]|nr:ABC transporter substrate-binding protein [Limnochordales bacterium]